MSDSTPHFPERRAQTPESWHLKKEIQLGQIASILIFGLTGVFYVTTMDKRITVIEAQLVAQKERDAQQDKQQSEALSQIRDQMRDVNSKLDRLVERTLK
jgi:Tfp pilus assembly protein PilO